MLDGLFLSRMAAAVPTAALDRRLVEIAPESLHAFTKLSWGRLEPARPFADGRVVHVMCETLEAVSAGQIKRLIINVPPGFMKSSLTGIYWPTWEWLRDPSKRWIFASYDPGLTLRDAKKSYSLLNSKWFRERWGNVLLPQRQPYGDYFTTQSGNRFSTSTKGRATGRHFERHVYDDPLKPKDALGGASHSEAALDEAWQFWEQTLGTRTADYESCARIICMQRLHEKDPSGRALAKGGYYHLCIPMRFDPVVQCPKDWRVDDGELAWPERFPKAAVDIAEEELGSLAAIAAQMQQRPTPKGGLIFKESHFRYYHPDGKTKLDPNGKPCLPVPLERAGSCFQSWDMTFKDGDGTDMVAGGVWQGIKNFMYLHHVENERLSFTDSCTRMIRVTNDYDRALEKLIENKANGPAIENLLKKEVPGIKLVEPHGNKVARANATTVQFKRGEIVFPHPELVAWVKPLTKQLTTFPFAKNDDMVDMLTQAIIHYYQHRNRLAQAMRAMRL